jgi:toxin ParE1/3/4
VKRCKILDEALDDLDAAAQWYEAQAVGLGVDLVAEFRVRLDLALDRPGLGTIAGRTPGGAEIRRYRLRRFKRYAILIATIHGLPTVIAFEHSSRRPGYWRDRLH